jgi:hypothetical protein
MGGAGCRQAKNPAGVGWRLRTCKIEVTEGGRFAEDAGTCALVGRLIFAGPSVIVCEVVMATGRCTCEGEVQVVCHDVK